MLKFYLLCIICSSSLFAYDDMLLKTQASIFPKIILLDKNIQSKLVDEKIVFTIIHKQTDTEVAKDIKDYLHTIYQEKIGKYPYEVQSVLCKDTFINTQATAFYVLGKCPDVENIADNAREKGIISFAYDLEDIQRGLSFTLNIERSTVLYMNKSYTKKIEFIDSLLQMVRFISKEKNI